MASTRSTIWLTVCASIGRPVDGNRRRQPLDAVHIRLAHQLQELPRVRREAFYIAALALGIDRIESQRGFPRAGQAGNHRQLVARNFDGDVLEVVLPGAPDDDRGQVCWLRAGVAPYINPRCGRKEGPILLVWRAGRPGTHAKVEKFFGSFFQKRTGFFLTLRRTGFTLG
jgi:hypothetical protein